MDSNRQKQPFLKTDNEVKIELNSKKKSSSSEHNNIYKEDDFNLTKPRYGTSVDLKTLKTTDIIDRHKLRDQNISENITKSTKYKKSRINIDSRYRDIDPDI